MQNRYNFSSRNPKFNQASVQQAPNVSFSSGMTSQQKFNSIVESVQLSLAGKSSQTVKGCQMHPKASPKCRKCQSLIQQSLKSNMASKGLSNNLNQVSEKQQFVICEQIPEQIKLNVQNPKNHLNQKLQLNITSSNRYKTLRELKSVKQVLGELSSQQIPIEAYRKGTNQDPTQFMVTLYRIIQLKPTKPQLMIMLHNNNVNIRALALIYIRLALDFEQIFPFMKLSLNDKKLINAYLTVGQLAQRLLTEEGMDQGGIRMPRIPTKIQKAIDNKMIQLKNLQTNKSVNQQNYIQQENVVNQSPEVKNNQKQQRSRSRQKYRNQRSSSSGSSSSSSSSSNSSSSSSSESQKQQRSPQTQKRVPNKQYKVVSKKEDIKKDISQQNTSLQDIRARIQNSLKQQQQKSLKAKLLVEKYQPQQKIQQNQQGQNQYHQESDSVEKYQIN